MVLRCVPKADATGHSGVTLPELRGRAVWEKAAENLVGAGIPPWARAAFQLQPSPLVPAWATLQLCPRLPKSFTDPWPPAWSRSFSIPMAVVTVPRAALLAASGAVGCGHGVPAPNCPAAACPGSAEPRPLLPIAKALLAWRKYSQHKKSLQFILFPFSL